ncbi:MAG: hypothetical protein P8078_03605 [bacterium]
MYKKIIFITGVMIILFISILLIQSNGNVPSFLVSCSMTPNSWWNEGTIGVMAESSDWMRIQKDLEDVFVRIIRTPESESTFILHISFTESMGQRSINSCAGCQRYPYSSGENIPKP